jgi:hypothetical protein
LNCSDGAANSLRDIITNPNNPDYAQPGDTVDLSQLPTLCAMTHSTITLTSGEIAINQASLTLLGPSTKQGTVTISGGGLSRVIKKAGAGVLRIENLTIADGNYRSSATNASGGCIQSAGTGSVYLRSATVTRCTVSSDTADAFGGGISASNDVTLVLSSVSGNRALAPLGWSTGAGIYAHKLFANYSSISGNVAGSEGAAVGAGGGSGGGAYLWGGISMLASTVDHNEASVGGGLAVRAATTIINSTISGNTARKRVAALYSIGTNDSLMVSNSTIAFNHAERTSSSYAVAFQGASAMSSLVLQSSIIARNTAGGMDTASDLSLYQGILSGADNLVMASSISDPNVITVNTDPKLGPLQFNGGLTLTHALLPGSPAIGSGNHNALPPWLTTEQRGPGYPRTTTTGGGDTTDMGAFEFDTIFSSSLEY